MNHVPLVPRPGCLPEHEGRRRRVLLHGGRTHRTSSSPLFLSHALNSHRSTWTHTDGVCVGVFQPECIEMSRTNQIPAPSNKAVLNAAPDLPLLYLFNQLVIAVLLLHGATLFTARVQIPKLEVQTAKKLTPVVSVNIIGLIFNTLCLRGVEASFFQIARGLVLPLTILVSCIHTHARPSVRVLIAAGVVTVGFLTGISPNKNLPVSASPSVISLIYGLLSSLFIAVHAVLIKASLPHCNNSTIELAYWTNLGSAVMVAPLVLFNGEVQVFISLAGSAEWDSSTFLYGSMVTGVFGFLLCVAGLLSIKITSPITHMFSSVSVGSRVWSVCNSDA